MDQKIVFIKSAKGEFELKSDSPKVHSNLRLILILVDGKTSVADLTKRAAPSIRATMEPSLDQLAKEGYIRNIKDPITALHAAPTQEGAGDFDLDFSSIVSKEELEAKAEAAARARVEAERRAKSEAALKAQAATEGKGKLEAEAKARAAAEAKARAEAEMRAKQQAALRAQQEAQARAKAEAETRAKAEELAKARAAAEAKAKAEAETRAKAQAEARKKAEEEARARAEAAAKAKAEAEARAKAEAEAKRKAEEEARARAEAEAKAKAEAEARAKAETEARAKAEAEARAKAEADARAKAESEARAKLEAELRQAKMEAEARSRLEAELKAKMEAEAKARVEAEARAKAEAEARAKLEQELKAKAQAEAIAKEESEARRKAELEAERKAEDEARARQEAEAKAKVEEAVRSKEEKEAKRRAEEETRLREEAEKKAKEEADARARQEAELKAKIESEVRAKLEAEARAKAEEEAQRKAEEEARRKAEEEAKARAEAEAKARAEAETKARAEAESMAKTEAEAKAKAEAEGMAEMEARIRAEVEARIRAEVDAKEKAKLEAMAKVAEGARAQMEAKAVEKAQEEAKAKSLLMPIDFGALDTAQEPPPSAPAATIPKEAPVAVSKGKGPPPGKSPVPPPSAASFSGFNLEGLEEPAPLPPKKPETVPAEGGSGASGGGDFMSLDMGGIDRELEQERFNKRQEADALARQSQAEAKVKAEQEKKRKEEEAKAKKEEEARARAEEEAKRKADEEAKKKAEEEAKAKKKEEAQRLAEEEKAKAEAKKEQEAQNLAFRAAQARERKPRPWAMLIVLAVVVLSGGVLALPIVLPPDRSDMEKLASERIHDTVKIGSVSASFLPAPTVRLENVSLGAAGDMKVKSINLRMDFGAFFGGDKVVNNAELESISAEGAGFSRIAQWLKTDGSAQKVKIKSISASKFKPPLEGVELPAFTAIITLSPDGSFSGASLNSDDGKLKIGITPDSGSYQVQADVNGWKLPIGAPVVIDDLNAKGQLSGSAISFKSVTGHLYSGPIVGRADLSWAGGWSVKGEIETTDVGMDDLSAAVNPDISISGKMDGKFSFSASASSPGQLLDAPSVDGMFTLSRGVLNKVDLSKAISGMSKTGVQGGLTRFDTFSGQAQLTGKNYKFSQLKLVSGLLSASGNLDAVSGGQLNGRILVELKAAGTITAPMAVGGTLANPVLLPGK